MLVSVFKNLFVSLWVVCEKYEFNAAILLSSMSSNDLIWVSTSSELCLGVAAVFNIAVIATFTIGVILNELTWDDWLSKSLLCGISEQVSTSSSRGRFYTQLLD